MKFHQTVLKSAVICSTLVASSAFAQYTFVDGTLTLSETQDAGLLWDVLSATTASAVGSTTRTELSLGSAEETRATYSQPITAAALQPNGDLSMFDAPDSGFTKTGTFRAPYSFAFKNFSVDLAQATLYADIETNAGTFLHQAFLVPFISNSGEHTVLVNAPWTVSSAPDADGYFHAQGTITNMMVQGSWNPTSHTSTGTLLAINTALKFTNSVAGGAFANIPLMDVSFDIRFAVPEPSTYALMATGLACLTVVARRRKPRAA